MKKKILLSSILTIIICLCLIAGSTFALFTSTSDVNIAVTAGKVEMTANIVDLQLYSVEANTNGTVIDENGNAYEYKPVSQFINGGTATVDGSVLTVDKITPGDKFDFTVTGTNTSDVAIQYRYIIECLDGYKLMSGLVVTINGTEYESLASYTSAYSALAVEQDIAPINVTVELPVTAGNEYQAQTTSIRVVVEAVQGNAVVADNTAPVVVSIPAVSTPDDLKAALANADIPAVNVLEDMAVEVGDIANKTIYANGNDVRFTFTGTVDDVTVDGVVAKVGGNSFNLKAATGTLAVVNSKLLSAGSTSGAAFAPGPNASLVIDNCAVSSAVTGKAYGIYNSGASGSLTVTNCTFEGFGSWAIQVNSKVNGSVLVDNCTFNTPDGVLKVLSGVEGDFTFTNNTMIGCKGHDGKANQIISVSCTGTATVTGNTLDGAAWTQE